ncbi:uncharacterized, partial [Tachysurus ichikawai]
TARVFAPQRAVQGSGQMVRDHMQSLDSSVLESKSMAWAAEGRCEFPAWPGFN